MKHNISRLWVILILIGVGFMFLGQVASFLGELSIFWEILPDSIRNN
tara:strand:- start:6359 stop:6499 length:141 start_codon:yes stop_codon:yes gene_type:complete